MFRLVSINDRAAFDYDGSWYDLAALSDEATLADPLAAVACHRDLHEFYGRCASERSGGLVADALLGAPVPQPRQVFGIGLADPDDLALWCDVAGERMQAARSSQLIFSIPTLVAYLSSICRLYPGDLVSTGTPHGVGMARARYLAPGDTIVSGAELIGELHNTCRAGTGPLAT